MPNAPPLLAQPTVLPTTAPSGGLRFKQKSAVAWLLAKCRVKEYLTFDSRVFQQSAALTGLIAARVLERFGRNRQAFLLLSKLHRADWSSLASAHAEQIVRDAVEHAQAHKNYPVLSAFEDHVKELRPNARTSRFWDDPSRLLGPMAIVLKSASDGEKGVILLQYSYSFPLFARFFDIERIASRYYLVLEPDWSGYCDINILHYTRFRFPVFVQAFEPRDAEFVTRTQSNLIVVPTSTNWWVDHRLFRPLPGNSKDTDVVMVAGWGQYKRHLQFFRALATLRRHGRALRVLLLGYPTGLTRDDILRYARYFRIADQLEIHEWVPYERVNEYINRAKVNVIWSRKEGVNRAIIEGMFADVPCLVREGFNYGYHYPYINPQTGCFASERDLPKALLTTINASDRFTPNAWVTRHMSCQRATQLLADVIGRTARERGEAWSGDVAVKVNKLHNVEYWNPADSRRFEPDYAYLRTVMNRSE